MADTPLSDSAARAAALDPARSFIVQAPAGSGKTELLVRRYLKLLGTVEKPEEILAITFTRKAAAEMRNRVLKEMPPESSHRLRIETIDALCASLARQMPVLSRFGAPPEILEDASALYHEAAQRVLQELSDPAARLLAHVDNNVDTATALIASMLARRDQWLRKTGNPPTRQELEVSLSLERSRILQKAKALDPRASPEFADEVLTQEGTWRKKAPYPGIVGNEPLRQALVALRTMPPERYTDAQWEVLEAIVRVLPRAVAHLKVVFAESGEADFTEIAQGALLALGTPEAPTDLLLSLDYRIRHVLVDEFQDTSISQWELLERLTAGWQPGDGRTLFLVGDPMQSIYRFREAEVALFLHAQRAGLGGVKLERLTLSTNFRSQEPLVAWFNSAFSRILPAAADESSGAVPYTPSTPHPGNKSDNRTPADWHLFPDRQTEARAVVELARKAEGRAAILVRRRDALAAIVPALKAAGIRYRAIEIEHLGEKQVVQDLYALARALTHLGDRIAWLSILRAPWLGLSLQELHSICGHDRYSTIWELIKDNLFLERFTRVLAPAIAGRGRGTLRDRVEGVWLALGGPACVEDETGLEDAEIFLDQLERLEHAGNIDFAALGESLDKLYALPDVAAGDESLQVMTIHKAKGLEFDTVIVPGLDLQSGRDESSLFLWKEQVSIRPPDKGGSELPASGGLLLAPIKATGEDTDPAYEYLRRLERDAEDTEASRLLYVAATRAAKRLHLLACGKCDEDGTIRSPHKRSLLARAWPVAEEVFSQTGLPPAAPEPAAPAQIFKLKRLSSSYVLPTPPPAVHWTAPEEGRAEEQEIEFSWVGETARHVGTVVHRWLQRIAEDELRGWDAHRVDALSPVFTRELERRGIPLGQAKRAADLVSKALVFSLSDDRGRWVLGSHPEARSEYRMRVRAPDGTRTLVMDRVFRDGEEQWVVDYKTSRHEGADLEAFLDRERDRYAAQLDAYGSLFADSRRGLYFPLLRGWRSR